MPHSRHTSWAGIYHGFVKSHSPADLLSSTCWHLSIADWRWCSPRPLPAKSIVGLGKYTRMSDRGTSVRRSTGTSKKGFIAAGAATLAAFYLFFPAWDRQRMPRPPFRAPSDRESSTDPGRDGRVAAPLGDAGLRGHAGSRPDRSGAWRVRFTVSKHDTPRCPTTAVAREFAFNLGTEPPAGDGRSGGRGDRAPSAVRRSK